MCYDIIAVAATAAAAAAAAGERRKSVIRYYTHFFITYPVRTRRSIICARAYKQTHTHAYTFLHSVGFKSIRVNPEFSVFVYVCVCPAPPASPVGIRPLLQVLKSFTGFGPLNCCAPVCLFVC